MEGDDKVRVLGQYPTRFWVAEALIERHFSDLDMADCVVEPACGPGAFLGAIPAIVPAIGIDIDPGMAVAARANTGRTVLEGDFRTIELELQPTVILGNPPFRLSLIDQFLERSYQLLPVSGRVGFILPAYALQTAARVAGYAERWSIQSEMIPRNIYPNLSKPLCFVIFSKDRRRTLIGLALYREAADVERLPDRYRRIFTGNGASIWGAVVEEALIRLGGQATLDDIYGEVEGHRPTSTKFWREKIRQTLQRHFCRSGRGQYRLPDANARQVA